ncbi:Protein FAR1-RELATED SEQUENCE 11 [Linum perenne]
MMSAEAGKILSVYDDPSDQQSLSLDDFTSTEESLDETTRLSLETTTDDAIPYIGQRFVTHDSAYQFYSEFAKRCGFSIRRHRTEGKDGVGKGLTRRYFVCHRAGNTPVKTTNDRKPQRNRKSSRCGCQAYLRISKSLSEEEMLGAQSEWRVTGFANQHNHELLEPNQVRFLPAYRTISDADKSRILMFAQTGISVQQMIRLLELEKCIEPGYLPFTEKDVRNLLQSFRKLDPEDGSIDLLRICRNIKDKEPNFKFEYMLDSNNRLENIAWSSASSIKSYEAFGDAVVFDTTHRLTAFDMPLGIWVGVNNYGMPCFFGCVLLREENLRSLSWALKAFLQFMDGKAPQTMLTDQNMCLNEAVAMEMPSTKHALCMWMVVAKFPSWFNAILGERYNDWKTEFHRLYNLEMIEDFELGWRGMVTSFGLHANRHITNLYALRNLWALPYLRSHFLAGMTAAGHSKSINSFIQRFLSAQTRLAQFVEQVGVAVDFKDQATEQQTMQQNLQNICLKTGAPMESHAASVLTPYAFSKLQEQLVLAAHYASFQMEDGFLVRHHTKFEGGRKVYWVPREGIISCSCHLFEFSGILCRHALRVLSTGNCFQIPERYLPVRWRRIIISPAKLLQTGPPRDQTESIQLLQNMTSSLISESAKSKERLDIATEQVSNQFLLRECQRLTIWLGKCQHSTNASASSKQISGKGMNYHMRETIVVIAFIVFYKLFWRRRGNSDNSNDSPSTTVETLSGDSSSVSLLTGEEVDKADLVSGVVWSHLSKTINTIATDELVGIDDHVEQVVKKLNLDSQGVKVVGLHGIGGIGKTTLATAVYNKICTCFDRSSFVENIRETQQQSDGVLILQRKLMSNILRRDSVGSIIDINEGKKIIRDSISQFKVLVVLDDVDEKFKPEEVLGDLSKFVSGSRFIITSRNIKILRNLTKDPHSLYEVHGMDEDRSLRLFSKHAFKKDFPLPGFEALSKSIVSTTGGLPLSLKVVGSLLFLEEEAVWEDKLEQLKKMPEEEVMSRLMISYSGLGYEAQQIFLDIACFYIGTDKEFPSYMWSGCNFHPITNINLLVQRSMVKIGDDNKFEMHDQLRDMGREIVRQESIEYPWKRSRIWSNEVASELLLDNKEANKLKVLRLTSSGTIESKFPELPESGILEVLDIWGIYQEELDMEIVKLQNLKVLRLEKCRLRTFKGGTIGTTMKRLRELDLSETMCDYDNFKQVIADIKELPSLEILKIKSYNLVNVLDGIKLPRSLKLLNTSSDFANLEELLELEEFTVTGSQERTELVIPSGSSSTTAIPWINSSKLKSMELESMKSIVMVDSKNTMLPSSLTSLCIRTLLSEQIPSLKNLSNLEKLELRDCANLREIQGLGDLKSLQILEIRETPELTHVDGLENLEELDSLTMYSLPKVQRLPSLSKLRKLKKLTLFYLTGLREIVGLGDGLKSLESLSVYRCSSLERLPIRDLPISNMRSMLLDLRGCTNFIDIESDLSTLTSTQRGDLGELRPIIYWPHESFT